MTRSPSEVIISELTRIRESLDRLEKQESASKEAFSSLYAEMEEHKRGTWFAVEKQVLKDLLLFADSMQWALEQTTDPATTQQLQSDLLDLLARYDVVPFPESRIFDAKVHRVLKVVPTDDPSLDGQIASVLKKGFYRGDEILRVEDVTIYQVSATK